MDDEEIEVQLPSRVRLDRHPEVANEIVTLLRAERTRRSSIESPEEVIQKEMSGKVERFWRGWIVSRALDTLHRKLVYRLATRSNTFRDAELWPSTMVIPAAVTLPVDVSDHEARIEFLKAMAEAGMKVITRPVHSEPHPADWLFQGELSSSVTVKPLLVDPDRLIVFLCPVHEIGATSIKMMPLGLILSGLSQTELIRTGGPLVERVAAVPEDGHSALSPDSPEGEVLTSTLPFWLEACLPYLSSTESGPPRSHDQAEELALDLSFVPPPPRPDIVSGTRLALRRSILPQLFRLVQETISPSCPNLVACHMSSPSPDGATLYTIASSDNYPLNHLSDVRVIAGGGLNWAGMGLEGRAALFGDQVVSRYGGMAIPEDVRDRRVLFASDERVVEAVATPIQGGGEKATGLGITNYAAWRRLLASPGQSRASIGDGHLYAVLYTCTTEPAERGLLRPEHVLWLRELAASLSEYFGWASASSMRDRRLSRDRRVGYRTVLSATDSERIEQLAPILVYLREAVRLAEGARPVPSPRPNLVDLTGGVTFIFLNVAGGERVPGGSAREMPQRLLPHLRATAVRLGKRWQARKHISGYKAAYYRGGILLACTLIVDTSPTTVLEIVNRYLVHLDWGDGVIQPKVTAYVIHRTFEELADSGLAEEELDACLLGLRRLDGTIRRFQKLEQREIAKALGAASIVSPDQTSLRMRASVRMEVAPEELGVSNENSRVSLVAIENPDTGEIRPYIPREMFAASEFERTSRRSQGSTWDDEYVDGDLT